MQNHLWCPNDTRGLGIDDDDDDETMKRVGNQKLKEILYSIKKRERENKLKETIWKIKRYVQY